MEFASRVQHFGSDTAAVLDLVAGGPGKVLVLTGPAGSGRSTILRAVAEAATVHAATVHAATVHAATVHAGTVHAATGHAGTGYVVRSVPGEAEETPIPYAALQRLVGTALAHANVLPRWQSDALGQAVEGMPVHRGRLALGLATLGVLREQARERPLLLLADDAHLLDRPSWEVLSFVARRLENEPITLLATVAAGQPTGGLPTRRLARWNATSARRLLDERAPGIGDDMAEAVAELAGGSPGALADLAAALSPEQRRGDAPAPVTLPEHSRVATAFRTALAELPADTRMLVLVAAAGADDLRPSDLHAAALAGGLSLAALAPAEQAGLISTAGPVVTFAEPVTRAVAYYDVPLEERRAVHELLARTLTAGGRRLPALIHRAAATPGPDEGLSRALIEAATGAAPRTAATALEHAARLTACAAAATEVLLDAAGNAWMGGQRHRATLLVRRTAPTGPAEARAISLDADMRLRDGTPGDALLHHARKLAEQRDVAAAAEALMLAGESRYLAGRHDTYREIAQEMAKLRHENAPPALTLAFCHVAGLAAMFRGDHEAAFPELRRVVELADKVPQPAALIRAAHAGLLIGDSAAAAALAGRAVALARARGEAALVPRALEVAVFADLTGGRYEQATTSALDGVALARSCGQSRLAQSLLGLLAVLAALAGDRDTCTLRIREAGAHDGHGGPEQSRALCEWALGLLDLVLDRPKATVERLRGLFAATAGHGNVVLQVAALPYLVEAAWRCGDAPSADAPAQTPAQAPAQAPARVATSEAVFAAFDRWAGETGKPTWLALRERCLAMRATDEQDAEQHFREALDLHAAGDADFPRAHTELLFGRELRRRRRPVAARDYLRSALETFHLLDARPWAEQADGELRAAGEHVDRAGGEGLPLTAQQERIARLVAGGATNREVAARMYLSPRTVDHHLRNVFIRLGVRSRTELARLIPSA